MNKSKVLIEVIYLHYMYVSYLINYQNTLLLKATYKLKKTYGTKKDNPRLQKLLSVSTVKIKSAMIYFKRK